MVIRGITAFPTFGNFASTPSSLIFRDTDDEFYPDDLSFIKKLAAVGDSYSAGIGAGDLLGGFTGTSLEYVLTQPLTWNRLAL